jgi:MgtC family.
VDAAVFQNLAIALGLGLLVGLQRESVATPLGGLRTFALVTLLGAVCGDRKSVV